GYGQWEGFSWKEIQVTHPTALADWRADPHGYCPPGGETHVELRRRTAELLAEIAASGRRKGGVGHGVRGYEVLGPRHGVDAPACGRGQCAGGNTRMVPSSACGPAARKRSPAIEPSGA